VELEGCQPVVSAARRAEWERQSKEAQEEAAAIAGIVDEAQRLLSAGQPADAEHMLVEGLRRFPARAELEKLRRSANVALRAERERQAREVRKEQAEVASIVGEVGRLLAAHQPAEADRALTEGLRKFPERPELETLRAAVGAALSDEQERQSKAALKEQAAIAAAVGEVQRLLTAGQPAEADRILVVALRRFPSCAELEQLQPVVSAARIAEWERRSKEAQEEKEAVAGIAAEVGRLLAAGEAAEADRVLSDALRRFPMRAELERLRPAVSQAVGAEMERKAREARLERAVTLIETLLAEGKLAEASRALEALELEFGKGVAPETARRIALLSRSAAPRVAPVPPPPPPPTRLAPVSQPEPAASTGAAPRSRVLDPAGVRERRSRILDPSGVRRQTAQAELPSPLPVRPTPAEVPGDRGRPLIVWLIVAIVGALLVIGALTFWRRSSSDEPRHANGSKVETSR
jgi:hypothetical protein